MGGVFNIGCSYCVRHGWGQANVRAILRNDLTIVSPFVNDRSVDMPQITYIKIHNDTRMSKQSLTGHRYL